MGEGKQEQNCGHGALAYDPSTWRLRQENENLGASLGLIVSWKPALTTHHDPVSKTKVQQFIKAQKELGM